MPRDFSCKRMSKLPFVCLFIRFVIKRTFSGTKMDRYGDTWRGGKTVSYHKSKKKEKKRNCVNVIFVLILCV